MPKRDDIEKVLVIGSGPITIGQAAEFDYSGTQAIKALKSLGYRVVVINSNSATIMTDPEFSDAVYIEPLTMDFLEAVIEKERPDALLPTLGGQTALNLAVELFKKGVLCKYDVELIGVKPDTIEKAEDREQFKTAMKNCGLEVLESRLVSSVTEAMDVVREFGYPVVIRPSFTLGGSGGGIAYNLQELKAIVENGLIESPAHTVLIEKSVIGWKEYELEVMKDHEDNFIVVCSIENFDPMGIHTGDSVTVAPAQTLTDVEYQCMRNAARKALSAIGFDAGGCNIQFAVDTYTGKLVIIEMNPRVSRSSALASKATGYPIAKISALLAVGLRLDEIPNSITEQTTAAFEPSIDYVVVKMPRFQMEKFPGAEQKLGTQMKSVGEVMSIGRTFKEALGKAVRSLELDIAPKLDLRNMREHLANPTSERMSYIFAAFRNSLSVDEVHELTFINKWFLTEIEEIMNFEKVLRKKKPKDFGSLKKAKEFGFSDRELAEIYKVQEEEIRKIRHKLGVTPVYKMVDTCSAEFEAKTPYFYSTYNGMENETIPSKRRKIMVLGSGPNRIGQGIEFDYANVHAVWAFQEEGYEVIMVNSNPETVSTDYDISDKLYFEPLTTEDILEIAKIENPDGIVVSFGGQTPLRIARALEKEGLKILAANYELIDLTESRDRFAKFLKQSGLSVPPFSVARSIKEALRAAELIGFPVLIRPSYVLGGRAMAIVDHKKDLLSYISNASLISPDHPLIIDKFLENAVELDVDVISDGENVWIAGLMEQIEKAGIHSGDSACVLPPVSLSDDLIEKIEHLIYRLIKSLKIIGPANIQLAVKDDKVYVIELNLRASRTIPFVSKAIGIPVAKIAAKTIIGKKLSQLLLRYWPYSTKERLVKYEPARSGVLPTPWPEYYSVKEAIIPFNKFSGVDILLGPEMRSTGEVMGIGDDFAEAFAKAQLSADGISTKSLLVTVNDRDKREIVPLVSYLYDLGFEVFATAGTGKILRSMGIAVKNVFKVGEGKPDVVDLIRQGKIGFIVITQSPNRKTSAEINREAENSFADDERTAGYKIRTAAIQCKVPCITTIEAFRAEVSAIRRLKRSTLPVRSLQDIFYAQQNTLLKK